MSRLISCALPVALALSCSTHSAPEPALALLSHTTPAATDSNSYALIVGVNDYSAYDAATGQDAGTSDLHGSRNDAILWWRMAREFGVPADRIRVLASPPLTPDELGPGAEASSLGAATGAEIRDGVTWLAGALGDDQGATGLLTFSGHGAYAEGTGEVLVPADAGAGLSGGLSYAEIGGPIGAADASDQLTVVLDACHTQDDDGAPDTTGRALPGAAAPADWTADTSALAERVISAASEGQPSYEAVLGGHPHGALTWSLSALTERWRLEQDEGRNVLTASYGELVERSGAMMAALGFEQTPEVYGPAGVDAAAFLSVGGDGDVATSEAPDVVDGGRQISGGAGTLIFRLYLLKQVSTNKVIGSIAITNNNADSYKIELEYGGIVTIPKKSEHWRISPEWLEDIPIGDDLKLELKADITPQIYGSWPQTPGCSVPGTCPDCSSATNCPEAYLGTKNLFYWSGGNQTNTVTLMVNQPGEWETQNNPDLGSENTRLFKRTVAGQDYFIGFQSEPGPEPIGSVNWYEPGLNKDTALLFEAGAYERVALNGSYPSGVYAVSNCYTGEGWNN